MDFQAGSPATEPGGSPGGRTAAGVAPTAPHWAAWIHWCARWRWPSCSAWTPASCSSGRRRYGTRHRYHRAGRAPGPTCTERAIRPGQCPGSAAGRVRRRPVGDAGRAAADRAGTGLSGGEGPRGLAPAEERRAGRPGRIPDPAAPRWSRGAGFSSAGRSVAARGGRCRARSPSRGGVRRSDGPRATIRRVGSRRRPRPVPPGPAPRTGLLTRPGTRMPCVPGPRGGRRQARRPPPAGRPSPGHWPAPPGGP